MRPRFAATDDDARRWGRVGGVALVPGDGSRPPALTSSALVAPMSWSRYWAGLAGITLLEVQDRGTHHERLPLTAEQFETLRDQCAGDVPPDLRALTTVFFTGTREGATRAQMERLREFVAAREILAAHHGLCVGADREFHALVWGLKATPESLPHVTGWPADVHPDLTVAGKVRCDSERVKRPPLLRNVEMARHAQWWLTREPAAGAERPAVVLVACPLTEHPPANGRGGTWHAVRSFAAVGVPVHIITPDGDVRFR